MRRQWVLAALLLTSTFAAAETPLEKIFTPETFSQFAVELAQKVPLFRKVWKEDPDALFFGGTARDYLFWVKRQFRGTKTEAQVQATIATLRGQESIDAKEFLLMASDVDVLSARGTLSVDPRPYGVSHLDVKTPQVLDPQSAGRNAIRDFSRSKKSCWVGTEWRRIRTWATAFGKSSPENPPPFSPRRKFSKQRFTRGKIKTTRCSAGEGLYGVASDNLQLAAEYGANADRIVRFPVAETTRIVDITYGEGRRVFHEYQTQPETTSKHSRATSASTLCATRTDPRLSSSKIAPYWARPPATPGNS